MGGASPAMSAASTAWGSAQLTRSAFSLRKCARDMKPCSCCCSLACASVSSTTDRCNVLSQLRKAARRPRPHLLRGQKPPSGLLLHGCGFSFSCGAANDRKPYRQPLLKTVRAFLLLFPSDHAVMRDVMFGSRSP